jgi:hypothetical protein
MATKLTATAVAQAGATSVPYEVADAGCPGLRLAVHTSGAKSWVMRFRSPVERNHTGKGKARKLTLLPLAANGRVMPARRLSGARYLWRMRGRWQRMWSAKIRQGIDLAQQRRIERRTTAERSNLVEDVFAESMAKHVRKRNREPIRESARREIGRLLGLTPESNALACWIPASLLAACWRSGPAAAFKALPNGMCSTSWIQLRSAYGHYSFEKEKREALGNWAQYIAEITDASTVVGLRHG